MGEGKGEEEGEKGREEEVGGGGKGRGEGEGRARASGGRGRGEQALYDFAEVITAMTRVSTHGCLKFTGQKSGVWHLHGEAICAHTRKP